MGYGRGGKFVIQSDWNLSELSGGQRLVRQPKQVNDRITHPQPKIEGPRATVHSFIIGAARRTARQIEGATDCGLSACNYLDTLLALVNAEYVELTQYQWLMQT
jgi:hypothetical protein